MSPHCGIHSEEDVRALVSAVVSAVAPEGPAEQPVGFPAEAVRSDQAPGVRGDVAVGADHGGFRLKERIAEDLREHGFTVHDVGTNSTEAVDYPDFAHAVALLVAGGACRWGIVVDGAGIGSCMAANKVPATGWGEGRHARRVEKITDIERRYAGAARVEMSA